MPRKKVIEEELFEDEKAVPALENNCFAFDHKKEACTALSKTMMTAQDKVNCGTLACPFYKPIEHRNSVKHVNGDQVEFETKEDYRIRTGKEYLDIEEIDKYSQYPHATEETINQIYEEYLRTKQE